MSHSPVLLFLGAFLASFVVPTGTRVQTGWHQAATLPALGTRSDPRPRGDEEAEAQAELTRAEQEVARGKYERALARLELLAERFPRTHAGRLALDRSAPNSLLGWSDLERSGPSSNRVDVVVMGDGYPLKKQNAFDDIAGDVPAVFEHNLVFGEYFEYFNFVKANVISVEGGIDSHGRDANTALGGHALPGSLGDHAWVDVATVQAMLNRLPEHDGLAIVFVPLGSLGAGGYGVASVGGRDVGMLLHQFGHAFGTLKDEFAIDNGFLGSQQHWINVSRTEQLELVPWKHWIEAEVPGVGLYEGADGRARGAWKPTARGCRMEEGDRFCAVCREALVLRIYRHVDPIESATVLSEPEAEPDTILVAESRLEFEVRVMRPATHQLDVDWFVFEGKQAPRLSGDADSRPRTRRGALDVIEVEAEKRTRSKQGVHSFRFDPRDKPPGLYRVLCRVRDSALPRGERRPWVLLDEADLLVSERGWWIEVPG